MDVHESDRASENPRPSSNLAENDDRTNRHGKSKSSWGLSTAVHAVHGVGFVAKKVVNNRLTESLWHSRKGTSSASVPSDASDTPDAKRENHRSDETVEDEQAPKLPVSNKPTHESENAPLKGRDVNTTGSNVNDQLEGLKPQDGSHGCTTGSDVVDRSENTKPTDGSHVKPVNKHQWPSSSMHGSTVCPSAAGSNVVDHLGNPKPSASSHVRQVNQHRWPSTTSSNVVNQSENLEALDGSHARLVNQHRWPGTVGSNVLSKSIHHPSAPNLKRNSKPLPESSSDATNLQSSSLVDDGRLKVDKFIESQPSSPKKSYALASRGVGPSCKRALTPARDNPSLIAAGFNPSPASLAPTKEVKASPIVRGTDLTSATRSASDITSRRGVSPLPAARGVSPSPATAEASATPIVSGSSRMPPARGASPTPTTRSGCPPPPHDIHTPIRSSSQRKSHAVNTVSSSPESSPLDKGISLIPTRGLSPTPSTWLSHPPTTKGDSPTPSRGVSPTPTRGVGPRARDVSPTSVKPSKSSGRRLFFHANILSIFTKIVDNRKEKNVTNLKEVAQQLELLYNIQVQWQFANASAEAALNLQRATAEKSLFDVWRAILELRDSLASKKVDIVLLILQLKLYAVLYRQMTYIDEWASIQKEHESALYATTNDLQARSLSLPITGGFQADIKGLKLIIFSTIQVLQATISCIQSTLSKLNKTHFLASELANLVLHERALLDECEIFLASAAPLHIEECSLRSYLLQSNQTSMTE